MYSKMNLPTSKSADISKAYLQPAMSKSRQSKMSVSGRGKPSSASVSGRDRLEEPNMSDAALLVTIDDLINSAFGTDDEFKVDFKIVENVLITLAGQMRVLEHIIDVRLPYRGSKTSVQDTASLRREKSAERIKKREMRMEKEREREEMRRKKKEETVTKEPSIEVVSMSQFRLLEEAVNALQSRSGPVPFPSLPDLKTLMSGVLLGTVSHEEAIRTLRVGERVQAAEKAINHMAELLAQLASKGAMPSALATQAARIHADVKALVRATAKATKGTNTGALPEPEPDARKWVVIDPKTGEPTEKRTYDGLADAVSQLTTSGRGGWAAFKDTSTAAIKMTSSKISQHDKVALGEMEDILSGFHDDLINLMKDTTHEAMNNADDAMHMASVADYRIWETEAGKEFQSFAVLRINEDANLAVRTGGTCTSCLKEQKLRTTLKISNRVLKLHEIVEDYKKELGGLDAGILPQIQYYEDHLKQMYNDLQAALDLIAKVSEVPETVAVLELKERFAGLLNEYSVMLYYHNSYDRQYHAMGDDARDLASALEKIKDQKADRDEVIDGLKDKANKSRIAEMLLEEDFESGRIHLDSKTKRCLKKLAKMDKVWLQAITDLEEITEAKASVKDLLNARLDVQYKLRDMYRKVQMLAQVLGDPKAALVTRKLAIEAFLGPYKEPAQANPDDPKPDAPVKLPPIPVVRPRPTGAESKEICFRELLSAEDEKFARKHVCNRWTGGSHTVVTDTVARKRASSPMQAPASKSYVGFGTDGKSYKMRKTLLPCQECNKLLKLEDGSGDQSVHSATEDADEKEKGVSDVLDVVSRVSSYTVKDTSSNIFTGHDSNAELSKLQVAKENVVPEVVEREPDIVTSVSSYTITDTSSNMFTGRDSNAELSKLRVPTEKIVSKIVENIIDVTIATADIQEATTDNDEIFDSEKIPVMETTSADEAFGDNEAYGTNETAGASEATGADEVVRADKSIAVDETA